MQVEIKELQHICNILLSNVASKGVATIELDKDYYWDIPLTQRYNPYQEPTEHTLGQLADDWSEIRNLAANNDRIINYHLVWLSSVIRAIGEVPEMDI
jgi:hypothetical protein